MYIKHKRGWELPESAATPESIYLKRRDFCKGLAAGPLLLGVGAGIFAATEAAEAADAVVGVGYCAAIEEAAGAEGFGEDGGEAFEFGGGGGRVFFQRACKFGGGFGVADQFVEADGDGLAEIHRAMLGAG